MDDIITLKDIFTARQRIAGRVRRTPLVRSVPLSGDGGREVFLKLETTQDIGAFKIRGATNKLLALEPARQARGVCAVSTGNHGRAVAAAARDLGIRAVVFMSSLVPDNKVQAIRDLGAEVHIAGNSQDEATNAARELVAADGLIFVDPFDDRDVIAGQGTIGLELLEDLPDIDSAIVPLSGGGLIGGIALALKSASRDIRVIGVTMDRGAAMYESQRAGRPVAVEEVESLADSLGGGIGLENRYTFNLVRDHVDDIALVGEDRIAAAMRHAYREEGLVVEGGGAVGIAALKDGLIKGIGRRIAIVISGRNVDMDRFTAIINGES